MPIEITIPRLGWNMDEGVFVAWLKNDGEPVKAGEPIFSLESRQGRPGDREPGYGHACGSSLPDPARARPSPSAP